MPDKRDSEFIGRVAIVTGGSSGLGLDMCRLLCEAGSEVYFCGRNRERGDEAASYLGAQAHFFRADLSIPEEIAAFVDHVRDRAGRVDYLVNNIADDRRFDLEELTPEVCDDFWHTNLRSFLLMTKCCLDLLRVGEGKSVVNLGTTNYMLGLAPFTLYNATKAGILGFTRSLAREVGSDGIRANMVSPGWVMTEKQWREYVTPADQEDLLRDQSLKFLLRAEHISPVVLFLLSSASAAITGQNIVVDGGKYMQ